MVKKLTLLLILNLLVSSLIALPAYATPAMPIPGYSLSDLVNVPGLVPDISIPPPRTNIIFSINYNTSTNSVSYSVFLRHLYYVEPNNPDLNNPNFLGYVNTLEIESTSQSVDKLYYVDEITSVPLVSNPSQLITYVSNNSATLAEFLPLFNAKDKELFDKFDNLSTYFIEKNSKIIGRFSASLAINGTSVFNNRMIYNEASGNVCSVLNNASSSFESCFNAFLNSREMTALLVQEGLSTQDLASSALLLTNNFIQKKMQSAQLPPIPVVVSSLFSITQDAVCSP